MKRSEKIEIRVTLDEKERLTQIASQEGESVSGLIRGLVEKYVALNSPGTIRRLPKWQLAALVTVAALIGHGLTLIPVHLHRMDHAARSAQSQPIYMVHGAIENMAFGVSVQSDQRQQEFTLQAAEDRFVTVSLNYIGTAGIDGRLSVSVCETDNEEPCKPTYQGEMGIERISPSVLGAQTKGGKPVHIFVQEMA